MNWQLVLSIEHLKNLCDINGRAEFYIVLAGGLSRSGKQIHYDRLSSKFDIFNEIDETWQEELSEEQLYSKTMIPDAIGKASMFFCGYQLWGI
jgi:hypothetical protein